MATQVLTLGVTGGVASGKSLAARYFAELGAVILDADRAGHEVLRQPQIVEALVERWGRGVLTSGGEVDRAAVAGCVFGNSTEAVAERRFLERLVHPLIRSRLEAERERHADAGHSVFILDAALLLESGWDMVCDFVIFVDAPAVQRQARAACRGWTAEQFVQRESAQWPVERKQQHADWVLSNAGTPTELRQQIQALWREQIQPKIEART
jgi:dephospho-CoA kinase